MADLKRQFLDLAAKIGLVKRAKPAVGAVAKKPVAAKPVGKKFDLNLFIRATQDFWTKLFKVSVPAFFKDPLDYLKKYPDWFGGLANDEKAAHIIVFTGVLFVILGITFIIVL
ncbi:MAG: hypothetical protein ACE5DM_03790 [Candidatus Nanoarchaeia archaeon]